MTSVKVIVAVSPLVTVSVVGEKTASLIVVVSHGSMMVTSNEIVSVSVNPWIAYWNVLDMVTL